MRLPELLRPWIESLKLPGGLSALHGDDFTLRGHSHYYSPIRNIGAYTYHPTPSTEDDWVMTVRADHVEIRDACEEDNKVINLHIIQAADPDFLEKVERDLRAVIDFLSRN